MTATIVVPDEVRSGDLLAIVSISGGKDSTACALALREAGVPFRMVFADTGWEAPETYAHLDHLRERLGPIDVVGAEGGMVAKIRARAGFPARMQRWCTRELKIEPLRAYHDKVGADGTETVCVMGVRADESAARAKMTVFEDEPEGGHSWGGWVWRPILGWSIADVIAIHHRHDVRMNPLYLRGHDRVGCYPCLFARKGEVKLVADEAPWRIDEIRNLEAEVPAERVRRNVVHKDAAIAAGTYEPYERTALPVASLKKMVHDESKGVVAPTAPEYKPRYAHPIGTFFQGRGGAAGVGFIPIDEVVAWSRTSKGGRQLPLLAEPPEGGCMRWGLCEPPPRSEGGQS